MLGITTGARMKGKPCMQWMDDKKKCNSTLRKLLKSVSERQEKVELISEQHIQEEKTDQYVFKGEGNGKPLL